MNLADLWQLFLSGLATGAIYGITALGFGLIYNVTHILNLAQGEFLMLGGILTVAFLGIGIPLIGAILFSVAIVTAVATGIQRIALGRMERLSVTGGIIITLGAAVFIRGFVLAVWGPNSRSFPSFSGDRPIEILGGFVQTQSVWLFALMLGLSMGLWAFFSRTLVGKAMVASAQNPVGAQLVGISTRNMATAAFALSGAMGALIGVFMTPLIFVSYNTGLTLGLKGFIAALIGGIGNFPGAVLGGFVLAEIEALSVAIFPSSLRDAVSFVVLIVVLLFLPNGLLGRRR